MRGYSVTLKNWRAWGLYDILMTNNEPFYYKPPCSTSRRFVPDAASVIVLVFM